MRSNSCFMCKMCISKKTETKTIRDVETEHTKIPVVNFIKVILGCKCDNECLLCSICLIEINELDYFHFKYEELKKTLVDKLKRSETNDEGQLIINIDIQDNNLGNSNAQLYKCKHCDINLNTENELKKHTFQEHKKPELICEYTGRILNDWKEQSSGSEIPSKRIPVHPFTCTFCDKTFTQRIALKRHMPLHTGECSHQCELCGKTFAHYSSFRCHKMLHKGIRKYKCNICDRTFINGSHLKRHMKTHMGSKEYKCEICRKKFSERYNLSVHRKIHNKENKTLA